MDLPRYIVLGDTILDREKIVMIYRDEKQVGRLWVKLIDVAKEQGFDGGDAVTLWRMFDKSDWREE